MISWRLFRSIAIGISLSGFAFGDLAILIQFAADAEATQAANWQAMLAAMPAMFSGDPVVAATGCRVFYALAADDPFDTPEMVRVIEDRCRIRALAG